MLDSYDELVAIGELQLDPAQRAAAQRLQRLADELRASAAPRRAAGGGFLDRLRRPRPRPVVSTSGAASGAASRC